MKVWYHVNKKGERTGWCLTEAFARKTVAKNETVVQSKTSMKFLTMLVTMIILSGCTEMQLVKAKVANAYDVALEGAENTICNDVSVGSVLRRYGKDAERAKAWRKLCFGDSNAIDVLTDPGNVQ